MAAAVFCVLCFVVTYSGFNKSIFYIIIQVLGFFLSDSSINVKVEKTRLLREKTWTLDS